VNLLITILICLVNFSLDIFLDPIFKFDDSHTDYYKEDMVVEYYLTALLVESAVICLLHKFTVNFFVTGTLITLTFFMLVSHAVQFFLLMTGGGNTIFAQVWYSTIIMTLHVSYLFPILLGIFKVFDE